MAKLVEWSEGLRVGIEEIGYQHKVLVDLVNEVHEAICGRHGSEAVRGVLAKRADYTRSHFAADRSS